MLGGCYLAGSEDGLVELPIPGGRVIRGIWLGVLRDTRHVRRIRFVLDLITQEIKAWAEKLVPPGSPPPPG